VEHVIKLEQASVDAAVENLPDGHSVSLTERIKAKAVTSMMLVPSRIKVLSVATFTLPTGQVPLPRLENNWRAIRRKFDSLIQDNEPWTDRGVYLHPVVGWISMPDLLQLLDAHQKHHVFQLNRLRRQLVSKN
jgi:hypothetical protein